MKSKQIASVAALIAMIATFSKILGFLREAALAAVFGASAVTDAYLVAMMIPWLLLGVVSASIKTSVVPIFSSYLHDPARRQDMPSLLWSTFNGLLIFLCLLVALTFITAPWVVKLLAPGFTGEQAQLTTLLVRILLPGIIFMGLSGWAQGVLNAHGRFTASAAVNIPFNLIIIAAILLTGYKWGITGVAIGSLLAFASKFLVQLPDFKRLKLSYQAFFDHRHPGLKQMLLLAGPITIGAGAHQINLMVDRVLASGLAQGSISALYYANRALSIPVDLLATPLVTVLYPSLSRYSAQGDTRAFKEALSRGLSVMGFVVIPLTVGLIVLREDFVRLLFQRGAFDAVATSMTVTAFFYYGLGMLFTVWRIFLSQAFYALQDTVTPTYIGVATVAVNIGLNLILVKHMGLAGLALATSLSALVSFGLLYWQLNRRLGWIGDRQLLGDTLKSGLAAAIMGLIVWYASAAVLWGPVQTWLIQALGANMLATAAATGFKLAVVASLGAGIYILLCHLMQIRELYLIIELLKRKKNQGTGAN